MTAALLRKELRALGPAWLALSAALCLTGSKSGLSWLTLPIYFVGTCTLGALSFGYEYANDTLQYSLTLPLRRSHVLLAKQLVLGLAVAAFAGVSYLVASRFLVRDWRAPGPVVLVGAVFGLLVAPWLTILLRNALGGAVFSIVIPALLALISASIGAKLYGNTRAADAFSAAIIGYGTVAVGLVAATMIWPTFSRLEVLGPRGVELQAPWRSSRTSTVTSASSANRYRLLITKELHLHQLAAALAVVYAVAAVWIALALRDDWKFIVSLGTTEFYSAFVAVLAGAVVTAEERALGTLAWQSSLPLPGLMLWLAKVAVTVCVALALGVLWPFLIHLAATPSISFPTQLTQSYLVAVFAVVLIAIYVSSLCRTALAASVITVPACIGGYVFSWYASGPVARSIIDELHGRPNRSTDDITAWLLFAVVGSLALRFAYFNHRASDRPATRIAAQITGIAVAETAVFVLSPILSVWIG